MYNRYIRNDSGRYERMPQSDVPPQASPPPPFHDAPYQAPPPPPEHALPSFAPPQHPSIDLSFFDRLLDKLHLGDLDSGELLLLLILFLLFRQEADEEVLIALGLLLIL